MLQRGQSQQHCNEKIVLQCLQGKVHLLEVVKTGIQGDTFSFKLMGTLQGEDNAAGQGVDEHLKQLMLPNASLPIPENGRIFLVFADASTDESISVWALGSKCEFRYIHEAMGFTSDYAVGYSYPATS